MRLRSTGRSLAVWARLPLGPRANVVAVLYGNRYSNAASHDHTAPPRIYRRSREACRLRCACPSLVTKGRPHFWMSLPEERRIAPDHKNRAVYERQYRVFKEICTRQTKGLIAELS